MKSLFVGSSESKLVEEIDKSAVEIKALEESVQTIASIVNRLSAAENLSDLSVKFSELVPEIGAVLPSGVVLNGLSLTGGITDPLQLDVDLATASLTPVLIRNLVESDLFEAADVTSITPKGTGARATGRAYKNKD